MAASRDLFTGEARDHSTARVPAFSPSQSVAEARRSMVGESFDFVDEVVVLDEGRLVGLVALSRLLEAPENTLLEELMDPDPVVMRQEESEEMSAWQMVRRRQSNLAVSARTACSSGSCPPTS